MPGDTHNNVKRIITIFPQSLGATAAGGKTGKVIDRAGFETVELEVDYGLVTATNATISVKLLEGDATGAMTTVTATGSLLGTALAAGIGATSARASGVTKNIAKRFGYRGMKRYVGAKLIPTISGGMIACAAFLLGSPRSRPVAT